jgi:ribosome maturation factor RimP
MSAVSDSIVEQTRQIAERAAASCGLEIVEVEWRGGGRGLLRIYIDKPGGVGHEDCRLLSNEVSTILDVEEIVPGGTYQLEVSSPGLDRKLLKIEDYDRFAGKKVKVRLRRPLDDRSQLTGRLRGLDGNLIVVETGPDAEARFSLDDVQSARLVVEI